MNPHRISPASPTRQARRLIVVLTMLAALGAIGAWPTSSGEGVVVAVIDSGLDTKTPALYGRLIPGRDFLTGRRLTGDPLGHGTHVSTIIAGRPEHSNGIFGVAPDAQILPLRVGTARGHVID